MASTELERTVGSTTNRKTFTFSAWVKRSKISSGYPRIFSCDYADTDRFEFFFYNTDELQIEHVNNNSVDIDIHTTRRFRDPNAWMHIVLAVDTTQSTAADRVKLYINGVQETALTNASGSSPTYPSQDTNTIVNYASGSKFIIGETGYSSGGQNFDGLMSHIHFVDGSALAPTVFGSTDSTTGEWKINTSPSVTYGTNGFFLLKNDNAVTDRSGQGNNFTLGAGTLTKTEDNPSNNFATLNSKFVCQGQATTFSNGNTTGQSPTSQGCGGISSIGATSGKFYAEFKQSAESTTNEGAIGVCDTYYINNNDNLGGSSTPGYIEYSVGCFGLRDGSGGNFYSSSGSKVNNSSGTHANWVNGDIIMVAMDLDNNRLYFGKNGQWADSNTWSSATPSQYITLDSTGFDGCYHFAIGDSSSGNNVTWQANFGNGYFGTTAISSAGTNASGLGIFEYDVPSGYTALCTKGLNE